MVKKDHFKDCGKICLFADVMTTEFEELELSPVREINFAGDDMIQKCEEEEAEMFSVYTVKDGLADLLADCSNRETAEQLVLLINKVREFPNVPKRYGSCHSTGIVLGNYWGGGKGAYNAVRIEGNTFEDVKRQALTKLKDGGLDAGMGYESLIGAYIEVKQMEYVTVNGRQYEGENVECYFIGDLTEDQKTFLENVFNSH